jgi:hypothetical protein
MPSIWNLGAGPCGPSIFRIEVGYALLYLPLEGRVVHLRSLIQKNTKEEDDEEEEFPTGPNDFGGIHGNSTIDELPKNREG